MADHPLYQAVGDAVPAATVTTFTPRYGPTQVILDTDRDGYVDAVEAALNAGFETFIDLCAVDHLTDDPRFEVVVTLLSMEHAKRLRIKVGVPAQDPSIPTISTLYPGASFYEREAWDLFGVVFEGHHDLSRILMPDEWEGHPLRKDYAVGAVPVEFKATE
jgi:NADH-quinone oxidoreductase subunit C